MAEFRAATDKKVAVLVAPGLEEVEALAPLDILFRAGIPAHLISIAHSRQVTSSHQVVLSCTATLDELSEADLDSYDMVFLPGGIPGTPNLKADARVRELVTQRVRADRPVAAICAAPSILAELGLLEGRRATANPSFVQVLADHGAQVSEASVVVDGRLLTSRGMATAVDLGLEMVRFYLGDVAVEEMKERIVYQG